MEVPDPVPGEGQVKIKVEFAGICGSDIKFMDTSLPPGGKIRPPVILGHEGCGIVTEVGPFVTGVKVGDRVAAETTVVSCGVCRYCRSGKVNMCPDREGLGSRANGYFAEYVIARAEACHKIPDTVTPKAAALLEPLGCAVNAAIQMSTVRPGDVAVVFGPGTIGQCVAQVAKLSGAHVVMVGTQRSVHRLEIAKKLGVDKTLVTGEDDVVREIMNLTGGYGADIAYECVGTSVAFNEALRSLRRLGTLVVAASSLSKIDFDVRSFHTREIQMVGAVSTDPTSWDIAMKLLALGLVDLESLVSHVFPLDQWDKAFAKAKERDGMKVLLMP